MARIFVILALLGGAGVELTAPMKLPSQRSGNRVGELHPDRGACLDAMIAQVRGGYGLLTAFELPG
jgi:hypothetical protein